MSEQKNEEMFVKEVKKALDASVDNLDADLCVRLAEARRSALNSRKAPLFQGMGWFRFAFAGLALIALIWLAGLLFFPDKSTIAAGAAIEDLEIATSGENPDFYRDMNFYFWLSTKKDQALNDSGKMVCLPGRETGKTN
jgi:hypothetical protein